MNRRQFLVSGTAFQASAFAPQVPTAENLRPRFAAQPNHCTLSNSLISRSVDVSQPGLHLLALQNVRTAFDWAHRGREADLLFAETGRRVTGLTPDSGFRFLRQSTVEKAKGALECRIDYIRDRPDTLCSFYWTGFPESPVIQQRCVIHNTGTETLTGISRFDPLCMWLRDDGAPLLAHWVQGMRGSETGPPDPEPYRTFRYRREPLGQTLRLVGGKRAAELDTGWLGIENTRANEILFVGIEWAGEWGIRVLRSNGAILLTGGVINSVHDLLPGQTLASPRVFVGVSHGDLNTATQAMHRYLIDFVLPPQIENFPWVTYEPWLPLAANMEEAYWPEVEAAKQIGVECFYIGPHWYEGSNQNLEAQNHNYTPGLGTWRENRKRFPHGLRAFSGRIHGLGLKFGVWVEPERIDDRLVPSKFPASFLASHEGIVWKRIVRDAHGLWDPPGAAVCLGNPQVVAWLKESLGRMVEDYGIDWVKWDNNFYEICDDPSHGHQAGNGNYAHMLGVYSVWEHLLSKYPHLVIENCAGGGNRFDFGLARYCRTSWLADSTAPSYRVRYHVEGASVLMPPPYLYSWVWTPRVDASGAGDSLAMNTFMAGLQELVDRPHSAGFLDNLFRSRMMGACGIGLNGLASARASLWSDEVKTAAQRNIANFKKYRHLFWETLYRATPQPHLDWPGLQPPAGWEVMEYVKRDGTEAAYLCFRGNGSESRYRVRPHALQPSARYSIASLNTGKTKFLRGSAALESGITIDVPEKMGSEILLLKLAPV